MVYCSKLLRNLLRASVEHLARLERETAYLYRNLVVSRNWPKWRDIHLKLFPILSTLGKHQSYLTVRARATISTGCTKS